MRKLVLILSIAAALLLDVVIAPGLGLSRFAPDALIALFVSLSVLTGLMPAPIIAAAVGLIIDIGLNRFVGMSAIPLFLASIAGAVFYDRFYADNPVIPAVTAAAAVFLKEHLLLFVLLLMGGRTDGYLALFAAHILPSSLLTGALCALFHLILKRKLLRSSFKKDIDHLHR